MIRYNNIRVYPVFQAGAQESNAVYYDLATGAFSKEGLSVFDVRGDEIRESFIRVTPKIWYSIPSGAFVRSGWETRPTVALRTSDWSG